MSLLLASPALLMILGALVIAFTSYERVRQTLAVLLPMIALWQIWQIDATSFFPVDMLGYTLLPATIHSYTHIFATVFAIAALGGGIFFLQMSRWKELAACFVYAGSAIGVTFAGDFFTFFVYWEIMAIASLLVIWHGGTDGSHKAGMRYAIMHFLGGVILLAGIILHISTTHSIAIPAFDFDPENFMWGSTIFFDQEVFAPSLSVYDANIRLESAAIWMILIGILVNVGAPPFSAWISDAYPESSPGGMVFLSAFTTKTAVFALLTMFAGSELLVPIGLFMVFYGIIYAILENDMRRILAFSIINQVGFMVTGIGIGSTLALHGAAAHAFCHIIYKALLLMSAGSVLYQTGRRKCSELGGLFRTMPLTCACGIIGALAISAFPLTSGFVSKSLISAAAADKHLTLVWFALAAASAGVFLHAGIKFPWFVFFQKDSGLRPEEPPISMRVAMVLFAALCIIPGIFPSLLYSMLPTNVSYNANTWSHTVSQLQLLLFSGLAFFVCLPMLKRTPTITLNFDWFYRVPLMKGLITLEKLLNQVYTSTLCAVQQFLLRAATHAKNLTAPGGGLAETKPLANTALLLGILLAGYLLLYFNTY